MRSVFADEKELLKRDEVITIKVPLFKEVKIEDLYQRYKDDPAMKLRLPDFFPKGRQIDRTYFFNVLNTVHTSDMEAILAHAFKQRNMAAHSGDMAETIKISEEWLERLKEVPFRSSKSSPILTVL